MARKLERLIYQSELAIKESEITELKDQINKRDDLEAERLISTFSAIEMKINYLQTIYKNA